MKFDVARAWPRAQCNNTDRIPVESFSTAEILNSSQSSAISAECVRYSLTVHKLVLISICCIKHMIDYYIHFALQEFPDAQQRRI